MWFLIAALAFICAVSLCLAPKRPANRMSYDDRVALSHTIFVNLSILEGEVTELDEIARGRPTSAAVEQAQELLAAANGIAVALRAELELAPDEELGGMLTEVFGALNATHRARYLLGAISPYSGNA